MRKIENRFLANYILMFIISIMISILAVMLLGFANDVISKTLIKNNYTAKSLMKDDYKRIDTSSVIKNGGGVQVINTNYEVMLSKGLDTISKSKLTTEEFTEFLTMSKSKDSLYSYSIEYNSVGKFWMIVTFPTSLRIDFAIVHNKDYDSVDMQGVVGLMIAVILFYLMMLAVCTLIYSKLTSIGIITPLKKLSEGARRLRDGDYSTRVDLNLENEFGELEDTFNSMARQIEEEISLRKQSEENRKRLILDISHDLKNPLASIMGYSELCYNRTDLSWEDYSQYLKVIYENSLRANNLITDLFELSKMDSSEYDLNKTKVDICEYMREQIGSFIQDFDEAGFTYDFDIPKNEIILELDRKQVDRVFQNLTVNTLRYNPKGTKVIIELIEQVKEVIVIFKDNGIGIPKEIAKDIFKPFVRVDSARNSKTGGTGLGLAIVEKIIAAHGGSISLKTDEKCGCEFVITLPKI
jgi:signal transduction histidine kinase